MKNHPRLLRRPLPPKLPKLPLRKKDMVYKTQTSTSKPTQVKLVQDEITRKDTRLPKFVSRKQLQDQVNVQTMLLDHQVPERVIKVTTPQTISKTKLLVKVSKTIAGSVFFPSSHPASSRIFKRRISSMESSRKSEDESTELKYVYLGNTVKEVLFTDLPKPIQGTLISVPRRYKDNIVLSKLATYGIKKELTETSTPEPSPKLRSTPVIQEKQGYELFHQTTVTLSVNNFPAGIALPIPRVPRKPARQAVIEAEHVANIRKQSRAGYFEATVTSVSPMTPIKISIKKDLEASVVRGGGYKTIAATTYEAILSMTNLAIKNCQIYGRNALSLKGFFIRDCPDLSPLAFQLVYLNLSFNDLSSFPSEVFCLRNLQVLVLRNNPIKEIPSEIQQLKFLRILVMSFNYITTLPPGLFSLFYLEKLDLSYNSISFIPYEIQRLRSLEELNLSGNELTSFPPTILKLRLKIMIIDNNFTHPIFWKENSINNPQRLSHLATLSFLKICQGVPFIMLPEEVQVLLKCASRCDCCLGPRLGRGFRIIRACNVFGLVNLPVLYYVCSSSCCRNVKEGTCLQDGLSISRTISRL